MGFPWKAVLLTAALVAGCRSAPAPEDRPAAPPAPPAPPAGADAPAPPWAVGPAPEGSPPRGVGAGPSREAALCEAASVLALEVLRTEGRARDLAYGRHEFGPVAVHWISEDWSRHDEDGRETARVAERLLKLHFRDAGREVELTRWSRLTARGGHERSEEGPCEVACRGGATLADLEAGLAAAGLVIEHAEADGRCFVKLEAPR